MKERDKMKVDKLEFRFPTTTAQRATPFVCPTVSMRKTDAQPNSQYKFLIQSPLCANVDTLYHT